MGVYRQGKNWICDFTPKGSPRIRRSFPSKRRATEAYLRLESSGGEKVLGETIEFLEFSQRIINGERSNPDIPQKTIQSHQNSLNQLRKFFDAGMLMTELTVGRLEDYIYMRRQSVGNATVNRELAFISKIYTLAIEGGDKLDHPVRQWKAKHKRTGTKQPLPESKGRLRFLTPSEADRLVSVSPEPLKSMVEVALFTGMRRGEVFGLQWSLVNLENAVVSLNRKWKDGFQEMPLSPQAVEAIDRQPRDSLFVFPAPDGSCRRSCRTSWENARRRAGLEKDITFHTLRHTFASHAIMAGMDLYELRDLLGHQTLAMTMKYAHLSTKHVRRKLGEVIGVFSEQLETAAKIRQKSEKDALAKTLISPCEH